MVKYWDHEQWVDVFYILMTACNEDIAFEVTVLGVRNDTKIDQHLPMNFGECVWFAWRLDFALSCKVHLSMSVRGALFISRISNSY